MFVTRQWEERQAGRGTLPKTQVPEEENQGLSATNNPIAALGVLQEPSKVLLGPRLPGEGARVHRIVEAAGGRPCAVASDGGGRHGVWLHPQTDACQTGFPRKDRCRPQGSPDVDKDKAGLVLLPKFGSRAAGWRDLRTERSRKLLKQTRPALKGSKGSVARGKLTRYGRSVAVGSTTVKST